MGADFHHSAPAVTDSIADEMVVDSHMSKTRVGNVLLQSINARLGILKHLEGNGLENIQFLEKLLNPK